MPHVVVVNHVVVSGQCPNTCLPCESALLSGFPIIHLQPRELSFLAVQLKVSLQWPPLVHPYQVHLSRHFHFNLFHFQNSELPALLCWLRQRWGWSLKENVDLPAWLFWAAGLTVATCHSTLRWTHWQVLESIHFLMWQLICCLLLRPLVPRDLWHPQSLGEGRRELRFINAQGKGEFSLSVLSPVTAERNLPNVLSTGWGEDRSLLGQPGSQSSYQQKLMGLWAVAL